MRADLKAIAIAFLAYAVVFLAAFLPSILSISLGATFELVAPWFPYVAAFLGGITLAYRSRFSERLNGFVLSALIALSLGFANYYGPSDLPFLYASVLVTGISFPIVLFLVVAGLGAKNLFKRTTWNGAKT
jgi:hypothetical protein